jgi:hypothetical protein
VTQLAKKFPVSRKQKIHGGSHGGEDVDVGLLSFTPCGLVGRYQRFGGTYCLHLQTLVPIVSEGHLMARPCLSVCRVVPRRQATCMLGEVIVAQQWGPAAIVIPRPWLRRVDTAFPLQSQVRSTRPQEDRDCL